MDERSVTYKYIPFISLIRDSLQTNNLVCLIHVVIDYRKNTERFNISILLSCRVSNQNVSLCALDVISKTTISEACDEH